MNLLCLGIPNHLPKSSSVESQETVLETISNRNVQDQFKTPQTSMLLLSPSQPSIKPIKCNPVTPVCFAIANSFGDETASTKSRRTLLPSSVDSTDTVMNVKDSNNNEQSITSHLHSTDTQCRHLICLITSIMVICM